MKKVFIIGGTGNLSTHTVLDLLKQGFEIGIFTRDLKHDIIFPDGVKYYKGDRDNIIELGIAINDFKPDILVDFVCYILEQAEALFALVMEKLSQFIFVSTVDVYGFPLQTIPFREADKWGPANCKYAADKLACELFFQSKFESGELPLTIVRPAYSFGNTFVLTALSRRGGKHLIPWLRAGKPILGFDTGLTLIHAGAARNTGKMIAKVVGATFTIGSSYTCAHQHAITNDDYINLFANALGVKANIVHVPSELLIEKYPFETKNTILPILTRYNIAFSVDAFKRDFPDFAWDVSLEEAAAEYIRYNDECKFFANPGETILEDLIIAGYLKSSKAFELPNRDYVFYD